jgi:glycosyltransferase involved in cell wall biosynthesis
MAPVACAGLPRNRIFTVQVSGMTTYVAVTPVRDEERFLPGLIRSMAAQSRPPARWLVVDDGSTDASGQILDRAAAEIPWLSVWHLSGGGARAAGGESAVMRILTPELWTGVDYLLRLDADLTFGSVFAHQLIAEFARDPRLGIAGATLCEPHGDSWREVRQPAFHTRGAVKMYSRECFEAIGGLGGGLGWDTLDEARAMMLGYRTRHFRHILAYHHRPQGRAAGAWRARMAAGRAAYQVGYSWLFLMARAAATMAKPPRIVGGLAMIGGYFDGYLKWRPRAASPELVKFVRRQQMRRLLLRESQWR